MNVVVVVKKERDVTTTTKETKVDRAAGQSGEAPAPKREALSLRNFTKPSLNFLPFLTRMNLWSTIGWYIQSLSGGLSTKDC